MKEKRVNSIEISKEEFKKIGYQLIDGISQHFSTIDQFPLSSKESPGQLQNLLGSNSMPEDGRSASELIAKATDLLFNHSLFNGHPKFLGYITSSASPIGALAELLAASVNPNVGAYILSPMATEIEKQTVRWLADFIGFPSNSGGILVSGGNMANFTAFLAARTAMAPKSIKEEGLSNLSKKLIVYCSQTTHTWIDKASILFGLGTNSIRWVESDSFNRMSNTKLEELIIKDQEDGLQPLMVVGTAGDVSTGAVDHLKGISQICKKYNIWFHIDGAYGIPAAILPENKAMFDGVAEADSIALDPHKWLYSPLEAGCTLVKDPRHLIDAFSSHPEYYNFRENGNEDAPNYFEYGFQNSRGFRALKVWLSIQQIGRSGYKKLISEDIKLSQLLFHLAEKHPELEALTQNLSITTLRYLPLNRKEDLEYLNKLNQTILNELQAGGELFLSHAIVNKTYCLRACVVNFRTSKKDIEEAIDIIVQLGRNAHLRLSPADNN